MTAASCALMGIVGMRGRLAASAGVRRLASGSGGNAGRERVAGIELRVDDGAALDAAHRAPGAVGECVALRGAVVFRIGVEDQGRGFVLFGELGFDAAIAFAVAGEDDFAFDAGRRREASSR